MIYWIFRIEYNTVFIEKGVNTMLEFRVINKGKVLPQYKGIEGNAKYSGNVINVVIVQRK